MQSSQFSGQFEVSRTNAMLVHLTRHQNFAGKLHLHHSSTTSETMSYVSDPDFSCGPAAGWTASKVVKEVLADLKSLRYSCICKYLMKGAFEVLYSRLQRRQTSKFQEKMSAIIKICHSSFWKQPPSTMSWVNFFILYELNSEQAKIQIALLNSGT